MEAAPTRIEQRRARTRRQILDAAWQAADHDGIAGMSLKDVATTVGMRTPSLWNYFNGRPALLDAMFAEGYAQLGQLFDDFPSPTPGTDHSELLAAGLREFVLFCQASIGRYQLLFTRAVPDWEPSAETYASSQAVYATMAGRLAAFGIDHPDDLDLWTALGAGLAAQQVANDPDGDRWVRLVDRTITMFLDNLATEGRRP